MNEFEDKKFKVEQTSKFLISLISDWRNFHKSWDGVRTELYKANTRERTPLLAGCAGVVSILLGLGALNEITTTDLYFYLALDVGVAIFIFLGYGVFNLFVTKTLQNPELGIITSIDNLEGFHVHFLLMTYNLSEITIEKIDDFFGFSILIEGANKVRVHKELEKISKMKRFGGGFGQEIIRVISQWSIGIDSALKGIESVQDEIKKDEWKDYLPFIKDLLDYQKEKTESKK